MIHIATAANENYAPGLLVMVASALTSLDPKTEITIHLMNGGISGKSMGKLRELCATLHNRCTLINIPLDESLFSGANLGPGNSYMAYARLLMADIITADKVIYIDADIVILKNLKDLWIRDMQDALVLGCIDRKLTKLSDDCPLALSLSEKERPYFNSGFIMVNLRAWREKGIDKESLRIAKSVKCVYHDQTILNYLFRNDFLEMDNFWNWQIYNVLDGDRHLDANYHFIEKLKPWLYVGSNLKHRVWRYYYARYVGSLMRLYASKQGIKGALLGIKERLVRRAPWFKSFYFSYLRRQAGADSNMESIITFYNNPSLMVSQSAQNRAFHAFRQSHAFTNSRVS